MAWQKGSEYPHKTQQQPLDRNAEARWRWLIDQHRAAGRITADHREVGRELRRCLSRDGRCDPSHAYLARMAACCERTVRNAIARLKACGLLDWTRRIVRTKHGARQTSSSYRLTLAAPIDAQRPAGKERRGTNLGKQIEAAATLTTQRAAAAAMLNELRPTKTLAEIAAERRAALWGKPRMA